RSERHQSAAGFRRDVARLRTAADRSLTVCCSTASKKPALRRAFSLPAFIVTKTRHKGGFWSLDLGFLVDHVLTHLRIELLDLHLLGMKALVLRGRVEVASAGGRHELDLFAHGSDLLLRLSRPARATRPRPSRCRAFRSCASRGWRRAGSQTGVRSRAKSDARAGSVRTGDGACCSRAKRGYLSSDACR